MTFLGLFAPSQHSMLTCRIVPRASPLVIPPSPLAIYAAEAGDVDLAFYCCFVALISASASATFSWAVYCAYHFRVAHFEVGAAI